MTVMKNSLSKVEEGLSDGSMLLSLSACYTARIRKAEFPNAAISLDMFAAPEQEAGGE